MRMVKALASAMATATISAVFVAGAIGAPAPPSQPDAPPPVPAAPVAPAPTPSAPAPAPAQTPAPAAPTPAAPTSPSGPAATPEPATPKPAAPAPPPPPSAEELAEERRQQRETAAARDLERLVSASERTLKNTAAATTEATGALDAAVKGFESDVLPGASDGGRNTALSSLLMLLVLGSGLLAGLVILQLAARLIPDRISMDSLPRPLRRAPGSLAGASALLMAVALLVGFA